MAQGDPTGTGAGDRVLEATESTFTIGVPLLVISLCVAQPTSPGAWIIAGGIVLAFAGTRTVGRRLGLVAHRGAAYTVAALVLAIAGLGLLGPMLGVGIVFALAVLFAAAFLPPRAVIALIAISIAAIAVRALTHPREPLWLEVTAPMWLALSLACGTMLWVATRVLTALVSSLQDSYTREADAYRDEVARREQLDRARLELEELAQVELVGRLAAGVAHDVNNALAGILAATSVMTEVVSTPEERRHLAELEAASFHAADLVRDLMWIGRKFPASSAATADLGSTMRACSERLERVARNVKIELSIETPIRIAMPPEHLEQVLFAAIISAHRAGAAHLALSGTADEPLVALTLTGGAGTTTEAPHAFRAHLRTRAAEELVAQYGGTLISTLEAGRLTVVLRIPRAGAPARATSESGPQLTALVVDDEPMILRRLCQLVARRGYIVTSATTLADALVRLRDRPSLVVTDIQLPDGSGQTLIEASFDDDPMRPLVVCSGYGGDDLIQDRLRSARIKFLQKPFTAQQLECVIARGDSTGVEP